MTGRAVQSFLTRHPISRFNNMRHREDSIPLALLFLSAVMLQCAAVPASEARTSATPDPLAPIGIIANPDWERAGTPKEFSWDEVDSAVGYVLEIIQPEYDFCTQSNGHVSIKIQGGVLSTKVQPSSCSSGVCKTTVIFMFRSRKPGGDVTKGPCGQGSYYTHSWHVRAILKDGTKVDGNSVSFEVH
jgi:hypothetical protein